MTTLRAIPGFVKAGFEANFKRRAELGAACCV
jgi:hypothetical protein